MTSEYILCFLQSAKITKGQANSGGRMRSVMKKRIKSNEREFVEATMNLINGKYDVGSRITLI